MADALASAVIDALLALELGGTGADASNRFSLDGVTLRSEADGTLAIAIRKVEAASLRLKSGPFVVEVGRLALRELVGKVRIDNGTPRLRSLEAAHAELSGVKVHGDIAAAQGAGSAWNLGPLAAAEGTIRAQIADAHLMFDADVTVPIRRGKIDFNEATVEHVGPDSSMGVSAAGLYVDAANGRSYLYQFASSPVAGVELEQRGGFLGAWVTNRGNLRLQAFAEGMLRQASGGPGVGFTEQARLLFERTALSGDLQLSDGRFAAPGAEADLVGRTDGRNALRLHSNAVGRGLTVEIPSLSVRNAVLNAGNTRLACDELTGAIVLRLSIERAQVRFVFDVPEIRISGVRLGPQRAEG